MRSWTKEYTYLGRKNDMAANSEIPMIASKHYIQFISLIVDSAIRNSIVIRAEHSIGSAFAMNFAPEEETGRGWQLDVFAADWVLKTNSANVTSDNFNEIELRDWLAASKTRRILKFFQSENRIKLELSEGFSLVLTAADEGDADSDQWFLSHNDDWLLCRNGNGEFVFQDLTQR